MKKRYLLGLCLAGILAAASAVAAPVHGLWVWDGASLVNSQAEQSKLVAALPSLQLTDLYLAVAPADYKGLKGMGPFIRLMSQNGVKVWGLDGCRCYFKDADGALGLYQNVGALIQYNASVPEDERFTGFQTDNEPQDITDYPKHFHDGLATSQLTALQKTQRQDLLHNWVDIQQTVYALLQDAHLRTSAAMVSYTGDYYGEPLMIDYNGVSANVGHLMMGFTDDYVVMTYNTDPANAAGRAKEQVAFASELPADVRPRVLASMEVDRGIQAKVSYGDTPGKASKAVVLKDRQTIEDALSSYPAFAGVSIHDWAGWEALPSKSGDTPRATDPDYNSPGPPRGLELHHPAVPPG